jgi:hypothetical protein
MRLRGLAIAACVLAAAVVPSACGSSSEAAAGDAPSRTDALRVLAGLARSHRLSYPDRISSADFTAARQQAGLPADADLADYWEDQLGKEGALSDLVRDQLPLGPDIYTHVAENDALDGSQITASARTSPEFGEPGTTVVATTQPYDEIEGSLLAAGMKKHGRVLSSKEAGEPSYFTYIASAGSGLVILTDQRDVARQVQRTATDGGREWANGAAVIAQVGSAAPFLGVVAHRKGCPRAIVAEQDVEPASGRIEFRGHAEKRDVEIVPYFSKAYSAKVADMPGKGAALTFRPKRRFKQGQVAFTRLLDKGSAYKFSCR